MMSKASFGAVALWFGAIIGPTAAPADPAQFRIPSDASIGQTPILAATIDNTTGNGARLIRNGSGFEPMIYRTWFLAEADAKNRVIAGRKVISHYDTLRAGALDGAEVEILRLENGAFRSVRTSRIPKGGFNASGWIPAFRQGEIIPAGQTSVTFAWDPWNRPAAPYWFTVRAVDRRGRLSPPAQAVRVDSPTKIPKRGKGPTLQRLKAALRESGGPAAPHGLTARVTAEGQVRLAWKPGKGRAAGFVLYRSDEPPSRHRGFYIDLSPDNAPIRKGDLVVLRGAFAAAQRKDVLTNRVWDAEGVTKMIKSQLVRFFPGETPEKQDWRLVRHAPDTPVSDPGQTYLELTLGKGAAVQIGWATDSGTAQDWYAVLEPGRRYRVEAWMKADRPARVRFQLRGFHGKKPQYVRPITFVTEPRWRKYTATFTPLARNQGKTVGFMFLETKGPVTLSVDNFRIFADDAPFMMLRPQDVRHVQNTRTRVLRAHGLSRTRQQSYDLEHLTNPAGATSGEVRQDTLAQTLALTAAAGTQPWLQIEPHLNRSEWLGLVEYLAAPAGPGRTWANKRAAQGRKAPWTEGFQTIYLELGNETWNRIFAPWVFQRMRDAATGQTYTPGAVYGLYQDYVTEILRQSPYWTPELDKKIVIVLGGWEVNPRFGADAARHAMSAEMVTTAPYIGGWEAGAGVPKDTPQDYARVLTHALQGSLPRAKQHRAAIAEINRTRANPITLGTYESGPGYVRNGLNGRRVTPEQATVQERVMKSVAAGTATLDAYLGRAVLGYRIESFFAYGPGPLWRSHAPWYRGGQAYPSWMLLGLFNREASGDFLKVETIAVPRADLPEAKRRIAIDDAPMIAAYATRRDGRLAITLISRQIPGVTAPAGLDSTKVEIDLPELPDMRHTLYGLTGAYDAHNVSGPAVKEFSRRMPRITGGKRPKLIAEIRPGTTQIHALEPVSQ